MRVLSDFSTKFHKEWSATTNAVSHVVTDVTHNHWQTRTTKKSCPTLTTVRYRNQCGPNLNHEGLPLFSFKVHTSSTQTTLNATITTTEGEYMRKDALPQQSMTSPHPLAYW